MFRLQRRAGELDAAAEGLFGVGHTGAVSVFCSVIAGGILLTTLADAGNINLGLTWACSDTLLIGRGAVVAAGLKRRGACICPTPLSGIAFVPIVGLVLRIVRWRIGRIVIAVRGRSSIGAALRYAKVLLCTAASLNQIV